MKRYRIKPGSKVNLRKWDPQDKREFNGNKADGQAALLKLNDRLEELQELLYAEGKHKLLVVLQATDTGGKDGTIRHVFEGVNPQGVKVASFKKPSAVELAHDYLWRIHLHTPMRGEIVIFNRSHYEDVLITRVHDLLPRKVLEKRYQHINDFERMLADEGTIILKFFLHISKDEQKERLQARLDEPSKHWKFASGDLAERKLWSDYQKVFEAMLSKTSTPWAPWHVIPANRKWYRNYVIAHTIVKTLESLNMQYPDPEKGLDKIVIE